MPLLAPLLARVAEENRGAEDVLEASRATRRDAAAAISASRELRRGGEQARAAFVRARASSNAAEKGAAALRPKLLVADPSDSTLRR
jgi:hypothetical protein